MSGLDGLGPEPVLSGEAEPLSHRHRVELAAAVLPGRSIAVLGVRDGAALAFFADAGIDVVGIEGDEVQASAARDQLRSRGIEVQAESPAAWAQRVDPSTLDAVVCLDLCQAEPGARGSELLAGLARLASHGTALMVGIPVTPASTGESPVPGTWSAHSAGKAFEALGAAPPHVIDQVPAEGSAFLVAGGELAAHARLRWGDRADVAYGGHRLALINLEIPSEPPVELTVGAPVDGLALHALQDANRALRSVNARLSRDAFARSGAAAAAPLASRDREIGQLRDENAQLQEQNEQLRAEVDQLRLRLAELQE